MEIAVTAVGVLAGKLWASCIETQLRRCPLALENPTFQLGAYVALAVVTGLAIRLVELHVSILAPVASDLSKGLIAGFLWSAWFFPGAHLFYARRRVGYAITYLVVAPVLVFAGLLGGYLAHQLQPYFS